MASSSCSVCQHLLENFAVIATRHLKVAALSEAKVNNIPECPEISSLDSMVDAISIARREAVDQFRIHLLAHSARERAAA